MLQRNITITLEKAKEWYNSDNESLREVALQAFSKDELTLRDFRTIKTFDDALNTLGYYCSKNEIKKVIKDISFYSKASAAMFKLNIIRKALNINYNLHLTRNVDGQDYTWYPYFRFIGKGSTYYDNELKSGEYKKLGEITSEDIIYDVLGGCANRGGNTSLGSFYSKRGVGFAYADVGFLGCATEEIAEHFGKHFGMLIMEAMYGDIIDFKKSEK